MIVTEIKESERAMDNVNKLSNEVALSFSNTFTFNRAVYSRASRQKPKVRTETAKHSFSPTWHLKRLKSFKDFKHVFTRQHRNTL